MYVHIRVPAYDMPTVRYEVIRPRHIYKSIVHVPAVSKKEGVDWMVEGAVDGIESTMSIIAFNRAALSGLWEVLSSGKRIRLALSARSLTASFSASDEKVIPSENLHPAAAVQLSPYLPVIFTCPVITLIVQRKRSSYELND